jgi:AbrB family looped-hinge helix DNA binding protein
MKLFQVNNKINKTYLTNKIKVIKVSEVVEMGKVSSRGQIAIPIDIRNEMGLVEGSKVLFLLEDDVLLIKKVTSQTWEQITAPLHAQRKKMDQENVNELIHRMRK